MSKMTPPSLVRFEIPVDDAVVVEILQSQDGFCKVHAGHVHRQRAHVLQQGGTVSTCKEQPKHAANIPQKTTETFCGTQTDLPRTPSPCTGAGASRRSSTWIRQTGSRRRSGCPSPRRPAVFDSSASGSACWSSSLQTAAWFLCVALDKQLCGAKRRIKMAPLLFRNIS